MSIASFGDAVQASREREAFLAGVKAGLERAAVLLDGLATDNGDLLAARIRAIDPSSVEVKP